jgi:hypothetical protein
LKVSFFKEGVGGEAFGSFNPIFLMTIMILHPGLLLARRRARYSLFSVNYPQTLSVVRPRSTRMNTRETRQEIRDYQ